MSYSILLACAIGAWATLSLVGSERVRRQRDADAASSVAETDATPHAPQTPPHE